MTTGFFLTPPDPSLINFFPATLKAQYGDIWGDLFERTPTQVKVTKLPTRPDNGAGYEVGD